MNFNSKIAAPNLTFIFKQLLKQQLKNKPYVNH